MATKPREPRFRILLAIILTAAIGGMFLAGEGHKKPAAPLHSTAADQRVTQQQGAPVAKAPSADEILTFTGRDPFDRTRKEKKSFQDSPAADSLTPAAQRVTPLAPSAGVTVSVGGATSPLSGTGSTLTSPTTSGDSNGDPVVVENVPLPTNPTVVDPVPLGTVPDDDGGTVAAASGAALAESYEGVGSGKAPKAKRHARPAQRHKAAKPAKAKQPSVPPYQAFQPAKDTPGKNRGLHKGKPEPPGHGVGNGPPGRRVGQQRSGWTGHGHAWGWKATCDDYHPSGKAGCWR